MAYISDRNSGRIRRICFFLISRYPFVNAVTLLLLLGERAKREQYPPLEPKVIYANLGIMVVCGICMGFNFLRKRTALFHAGQLVYLAGTIYMNQNLHYNEMLKIRMGIRHIGVAGIMVLYAHFNLPKAERQTSQLLRLGETLVGIYLTIMTYMLVNSREDRDAFLRHFPGGEWTLYIFVLFYALSALCFLPGFFVRDITELLIVFLTINLLVVETDIQYWTMRRGIDFWNHMRLAGDVACVVCGLAMYLCCTTKQDYSKLEGHGHSHSH